MIRIIDENMASDDFVVAKASSMIEKAALNYQPEFHVW